MMECWERAQGGDWDEGQVEERERFHGEEERALVAEAVVREVEEVEREVVLKPVVQSQCRYE